MSCTCLMAGMCGCCSRWRHARTHSWHPFTGPQKRVFTVAGRPKRQWQEDQAKLVSLGAAAKEVGGWAGVGWVAAGCLTVALLQGKTMKDYIMGPGGKLGELAAEVAKRGKRGSSTKPEDVKVKVNKPG